ncbi:hypothetical protein AACH10_01035 [Ideonella sp. DXS22W]|uniref:DUF2782 domain-containing protein n=1 Tax=Pseudaquabacterium inlustre TaxID=2984192 RepID=A0ABU9CAX6_9BURK
MTAFLSKSASALLLAATAALLSACAGLVPPPTEAAVARLTAEDSQVRIDELRVRGQTQRVTVQPKAVAGAASAPAYEVLPAPGGQDPSQAKDSAGRRVWPVLSF